ncbi:MAG TPA: hypothetical protein VHG09_03395 [Longimicrobiales bacterium]|nr:hypothetical protein [Longimicrobiales bacterium]
MTRQQSGFVPGQADSGHAAVRSVVCDVIAEAVRSAQAGGVVVLDDWTPEGALACEWLAGVPGAPRVWRAGKLASNMHGEDVDRSDAQLPAAWRCAREHSAFIAHPASKTVLLLGGPPPRADLFPFGDVYASQLEELTGSSGLPDDVAQLARAAGGIGAVDAALARLVDSRMPAADALAPLDAAVAGELLRLYERGRHFRLRPRLIPKLSARTLGIDLFD